MKIRKEFVRKSLEDQSTQQRERQNGNLVVNAGEARGFVHCAVKFGTGLFSGTRPVDKMVLRVADRELEVRKSGKNPKGLIGIKIGLGCRWLGRDERDLKGIECVK
jgi:hypothetical protein